MERIREEYKKLSKLTLLFVIPWAVLFNLLLRWLDAALPTASSPVYLLFYAIVLATIFSLGYIYGKKRCPILTLAGCCLQYLLANLLSFLPVSLGLELSAEWKGIILPMFTYALPLILLVILGLGYLSGCSGVPKTDAAQKSLSPLFPKAYLLYLVPWMMPLIYSFWGGIGIPLPFFGIPLWHLCIFVVLFFISIGCKKKILLFGIGLQLCYMFLGGLHLEIPMVFFFMFFLPCISPFFVVQIMGYRLGKTAD
ncbi:hypothetical protein [Anaerotignum sp.]|uniref:hypothetical protein n=1 Tax=Anaerotignum sp. TaxID=2039241 RepID=UPI003735A80E